MYICITNIKLMKQINILLVLMLAFSTFSFAQNDLNITLTYKKDWGEGGSGSWGHTDKRGIDYAIVGTRASIKVLSLEKPESPIERLSIPMTRNNWREARAYGDYIYVTTESQDGTIIIDISKGPDTMTWKTWRPRVPGLDTLRKAHSINMDNQGFMYLNGTNLAGGSVLIFDTKPNGNDPVFMSSTNSVYTHDCFATDSILYTADLSQGVSIYDVKDKSNPKFINKFQTSRQFTHNMWTSPDNKYLYTTDERAGAFLDVYDVSNPKDVKFISKYQNIDSRPERTIPHNVYTVGNFAVTAYYTDGVIITDMTRPDNIVKVGSYDTYFNEASLENVASWFEGCWGIYPFLKTGHIVMSDINTGFYLVKPTYKRASYLEGNVFVESSTGIRTPISGATVSIINPNKAVNTTNVAGAYKTGTAFEGKFKAVMTHPFYNADTVEVTLKAGEVTIQNFIIKTSLFKGKVVNELNQIVPNAAVTISSTTNSSASASVLANASGEFEISLQSNTEYNVTAGNWGYLQKTQKINSLSSNATIKLDKKGYQDDFFGNLGWTNPVKASSGNWELGNPQQTLNGNAIANPGFDVASDAGSGAYITGNKGVTAGDDDVDNGKTVLLSPVMNFVGSDTAIISFALWQYLGGGNSAPNDYLKIAITNGPDTLVIENITNSTNGWNNFTATITKSDLTFTNQMKMVITSEDVNPGHLVEAGFDNFLVKLNGLNSNTKNVANLQVKAFPNPTTSEINFELENFGMVELFNNAGVMVAKSKNPKLEIGQLSSGLYMAKISNKQGEWKSIPVIKE